MVKKVIEHRVQIWGKNSCSLQPFNAEKNKTYAWPGTNFYCVVRMNGGSTPRKIQ